MKSTFSLYIVNKMVTDDIRETLQCTVFIMNISYGRLFLHYHQTFNISRTKSQHLNAPRLVLQSSLPNPLKPGLKSRMIWVINHFVAYWGEIYIIGLTVYQRSSCTDHIVRDLTIVVLFDAICKIENTWNQLVQGWGHVLMAWSIIQNSL